MAKRPIEKYGGQVVLEGTRFTIVAAKTRRDHCPFFDEFFHELKEKYKKITESGKTAKRAPAQINFTRLSYLFQKICNSRAWSNDRQLKSLGNGYFEFKILETGLRVFFYYDSNNKEVIILTHAIIKKKTKTPPTEIERMKTIKETFENLRKKNGENDE